MMAGFPDSGLGVGMTGSGRVVTRLAMIRRPDGGDAVGGVAEASTWTPPYGVIDIHRTTESSSARSCQLQPKNVWSIRLRLEKERAIRELALFNLAIDSKLCACHFVKLKIAVLWSGSSIRDRGHHHPKEDKAARTVRVPRADQDRTFSVAALCSKGTVAAMLTDLQHEEVPTVLKYMSASGVA